MNGRIDDFINSARVYLAGGYSQEEAMKNVLDTGDIRAEVELESSREDLGIYNVFRFMPYLYFSILCFVLGLIQKEYQNIDIRRRLQASSLTLRNKNIQSLLAFFTVGIFSWVLCEGIGVLTCFSEFRSNPNWWLILLNGFTIMLGALAAAFFVGSMARTDAAVNGMANVLSLGFCFLGGIFVPLEMLTGVVRRIGSFSPPTGMPRIFPSSALMRPDRIFKDHPFSGDGDPDPLCPGLCGGGSGYWQGKEAGGVGSLFIRIYEQESDSKCIASNSSACVSRKTY